MFTLDPNPTKVILWLAFFIVGAITVMFTNTLKEGKESEMLKGIGICLLTCAICVILVYIISLIDMEKTLGSQQAKKLNFEQIMSTNGETLFSYLSLVAGIFIGVIHSRVTEIKNTTNLAIPWAGAVVCLAIGLVAFFISSSLSKLIYKAAFNFASTVFTGIAAGMFGCLSNTERSSK